MRHPVSVGKAPNQVDLVTAFVVVRQRLDSGQHVGEGLVIEHSVDLSHSQSTTARMLDNNDVTSCNIIGSQNTDFIIMWVSDGKFTGKHVDQSMRSNGLRLHGT